MLLASWKCGLYIASIDASHYYEAQSYHWTFTFVWFKSFLYQTTKWVIKVNLIEQLRRKLLATCKSVIVKMGMIESIMHSEGMYRGRRENRNYGPSFDSFLLVFWVAMETMSTNCLDAGDIF